MKIADVFQPRKVIIQNPKDSLRGFYGKVQNVLENQKIFVSQGIFAETLDLCQAYNGRVDVVSGVNNKVVYALSFEDKQKTTQKYMFCVFCNKKSQRKIQLVCLQAGTAYYKYNPEKCLGDFYLTRPPQKTLEKE